MLLFFFSAHILYVFHNKQLSTISHFSPSFCSYVCFTIFFFNIYGVFYFFYCPFILHLKYLTMLLILFIEFQLFIELYTGNKIVFKFDDNKNKLYLKKKKHQLNYRAIEKDKVIEK